MPKRLAELGRKQVGMATSTAKYKPYPAYKPSVVEWLGEIPAHWEVNRLKVTVQNFQNGVWGAEPNGENEIACVRVADFDRIRLRAHMDKPTFAARLSQASFRHTYFILAICYLRVQEGAKSNQSVL